MLGEKSSASPAACQYPHSVDMKNALCHNPLRWLARSTDKTGEAPVGPRPGRLSFAQRAPLASRTKASFISASYVSASRGSEFQKCQLRLAFARSAHTHVRPRACLRTRPPARAPAPARV